MIPHPAKTSSNRSFGLVFSCVFALIAVWPTIQGGGLRVWAATISATFAFVAFSQPTWLAPLNRVWSNFGLLLHKVVNPVVLGLIFVLLILPTGLLLRLLGKDQLRLKRRTEVVSYWIERSPPGPSPDSLPRQF